MLSLYWIWTLCIGSKSFFANQMKSRGSPCTLQGSLSSLASVFNVLKEEAAHDKLKLHVKAHFVPLETEKYFSFDYISEP